MTTGKTIALIRRTFVGKAMSLLFNMLSRLVITFLLLEICKTVEYQSFHLIYFYFRKYVFKNNIVFILAYSEFIFI